MLPISTQNAAGKAQPSVAPLVDPKGELMSIPEQAEQLTREMFDWLRADSIGALSGIAVGVSFYFLLVLLRGWARRRFRRNESFGSWGWVALKVVSRTRSFFLVMISARLVTWGFGAPPALVAVVHFLFTIAVAVQGAFWVRELLISLVERRAAEPGQDHGTISSAVGVLTIIINVVVWAIAGIILLDNLGVNVTGLVAGLGIGGIAIGLAAQGIFSDLFAALSILLDQPFKKGETIQLGGPQGVIGTVEHIGLKTTRLRAISGEMVIMSNANILNQQINNLAAFERRRVAMTLGVTYQTPRAVLRTLPEELHGIVNSVLNCRFDRAHFVRFGAYSLDFDLVFFVEATTLREMLDAQQAVGLAILDRFAELDVDIAYPTQVEMSAGPDGRIFDPNAELAAPDTPKAAQ